MKTVERTAQVVYKVRAFGIAKEIIGDSVLDLTFASDQSVTVGTLKEEIFDRFPAFLELANLKIAVNEEYAIDAVQLADNDDIVIIPPVAGG